MRKALPYGCVQLRCFFSECGPVFTAVLYRIHFGVYSTDRELVTLKSQLLFAPR